MALPLVPLAIGAVLGGGTVWVASEAGEKLTRAALLAGGAYLAYRVWLK